MKKSFQYRFILFDKDKYPRHGITPEPFAKLKSHFQKNVSVTDGHATGMNDSASAILIMSEKKEFINAK